MENLQIDNGQDFGDNTTFFGGEKRGGARGLDTVYMCVCAKRSSKQMESVKKVIRRRKKQQIRIS